MPDGEKRAEIPSHMAWALAQVEAPEEVWDEYVRKFGSAFGGLVANALSEALRRGAWNDRVVAAFALAALDPDSGQTALLNGLKDVDSLLRWVGAVALGRAGAQLQAADLCDMLVAFLPPVHPAVEAIAREESWLYAGWWIEAVRLLGSSHDAEHIPALRTALGQCVKALVEVRGASESIAESTHGNAVGEDTLTGFLDECLYALGRLGAYGALMGLTPAGEGELRVWAVHLCVGAVLDHYPLRETGVFLSRSRSGVFPPDMRKEITGLLQRQFGLTGVEVQSAFASYHANWGWRLAMRCSRRGT